MKRFPVLLLLFIALAAVGAGVFYFTSQEPQPQTDLVPVPAAAPLAHQSTDRAPAASASTASTSSVAQALADQPLLPLYPTPGPSAGKRLELNSPDYIKVSTEGQTPIGRVAPMDVSKLPALSSLKAGDIVHLPLLDGEAVDGKVNLVQPDGDMVRVAGELANGRPGGFVLGSDGKTLSGMIRLDAERRVYQIVPERDGTTQMVEKMRRDVICDPIPKLEGPVAGAPEGPVAAVQILNSRPGAVCQLYLDFDGETVQDPWWANGAKIVALPSNVSAATIVSIFNRVKEDFWPFNINVTTDVANYNNAAVGKRMRVIITPTDTAADGAGGVAYLDSFRNAGSVFTSNIPCWVFNGEEIGIAEAISHEVGHTFNLNHDGQNDVPGKGHVEYYYGQGSGATSWCPIMGAGYYVNVTQWSKGEYQYASNKEDDLQFISSRIAAATGGNSIGYMVDDAGSTRTSAAALAADAANGAVNQPGVIEKTADVDFYSFSTNGGTATIAAKGASIGQNLDIVLELQDSTGAIRSNATTGNPIAQLNASVSATLEQGTYYLKVTSTGALNPLTTGYSNYASLGAYSLTGTIVGLTKQPIITSSPTASGQEGVPFNYAITASGNPASFGVTSGPTNHLPLGVTLNATTGVISGVPKESGTFTVTISATNSSGTGTRQLVITLAPPALTLGQAVDWESLNWTSSSASPWLARTNVTYNAGPDAAQSGVIGNNAESALQTTVTGPVTMNFRWKVSSQEDADFLALQIDGVDVSSIAPISGEVDWNASPLSVAIPEGSHVVRWVYRKDGSLADHQDLAWVDTVTFTSDTAPVITSPATAAGVVGTRFSYTIQATNYPGSFAVVGTLPAGLTLNPNSGIISGVPAAAASVNITVSATNNIATDSKPLGLTIGASPISIGDAVENTSVTWTTGGTANWFSETVETFDGIDAVQAGPVGNNQQSFVQATVPNKRTVSFLWKTSSEPGDELQFYIGSTKTAVLSGVTQWQNGSFLVPAGSIIKWVYQKNATGADGLDTGWLDRVIFTTDLLPIIDSPLTATAQAGLDYSYQITAANNPTSFSAEGMPTGLQVDESTGRISGVPKGAGNYEITLGATNQAGTGTKVLKLKLLPSVADGVDLPDATFVTGGDAPWHAVTDVTFDGIDSVQSGEIPNGGESYFETVVTGPTDLSFRWKVSSEAGKDFLKVLIDGSLLASTSGVQDWQQRVFIIPQGTHAIRWTYKKDTSSAANLDTAWVDAITFSADAHIPKITSPLTATAYLGRVFKYQITGSNSPSSFGATGIPDGFSAVGGVIIGTPTVVGPVPITLSATNNAGVGTATLLLKVEPEPPGTDNRANATSLGGVTLRLVGSNKFASAEPGEANHGGSKAAASVWYTWTAPRTGLAVITTAGSDFDTVLSVYTTPKTGLPKTYENDDLRPLKTSALRFNVVAGDVCTIAVDGLNGATGKVILNIGYGGNGVYTGLALDENQVKDPGIVSLTLTEKLGFTGSVKLGAKTYTLGGAFTGEDFAGSVVQPKGSPLVTYTLHMTLGAGAQEVTGVLKVGDATYNLLAKLAIAAADVPPALKGSFTFLIEPNNTGLKGPEGIGYGTATIDARGYLNMTGTLGDGVKFTLSRPLALDRSTILYLTPYLTGGVVAGYINIDAGPAVAPISSVLTWRKLPAATAAMFPGGFPINATLKGYRHNPLQLPTLTTFQAAKNVNVTFTKGDYPTKPTDAVVTVDAANKVTNSVTPKVTLIVNKTGLFSGTFLSPTTHLARAFNGVIINGKEFVQDSNGNVTENHFSRGAGVFTAVKETGKVEILAVKPVVP